MTSKLAELVFVIYSILVIATIEFHKSPIVYKPESFSQENIQDPTPEPLPSVEKPIAHLLPRHEWNQNKYTNSIKESYKKTEDIRLKSPFIREEACLPIEGNIGMQIDIATEIFGPFEHVFTI
ncbi:MAG: hypothetical protein CL512_04975 [Actinobacteria bacterium]|nr:hypothetical protein [Actinomycetota bacterium]|tara:strand:- start:6501 stop:6869 length:369 start_codon:yes stop_codon:yes gene_type:complete